MEREFNHVRVIVNDPQNRLVSGEKIEVLMTLSEDKNVFTIEIPEMKVREETPEDKPRPVNVYQNKDYGVTGTVCANGALKVGIMLARKKLPKMSRSIAKLRLDEAFEKTWDQCTSNE